jgi:hypothetical protein
MRRSLKWYNEEKEKWKPTRFDPCLVKSRLLSLQQKFENIGGNEIGHDQQQPQQQQQQTNSLIPSPMMMMSFPPSPSPKLDDPQNIDVWTIVHPIKEEGR